MCQLPNDVSLKAHKVNILTRQLTCLWNKNGFSKYSKLSKTMRFMLIGVIFSLLIDLCNLFPFVHIGEWP